MEGLSIYFFQPSKSSVPVIPACAGMTVLPNRQIGSFFLAPKDYFDNPWSDHCTARRKAAGFRHWAVHLSLPHLVHPVNPVESFLRPLLGYRCGGSCVLVVGSAALHPPLRFGEVDFDLWGFVGGIGGEVDGDVFFTALAGGGGAGEGFVSPFDPDEAEFLFRGWVGRTHWGRWREDASVGFGFGSGDGGNVFGGGWGGCCGVRLGFFFGLMRGLGFWGREESVGEIGAVGLRGEGVEEGAGGFVVVAGVFIVDAEEGEEVEEVGVAEIGFGELVEGAGEAGGGGGAAGRVVAEVVGDQDESVGFTVGEHALVLEGFEVGEEGVGGKFEVFLEAAEVGGDGANGAEGGMGEEAEPEVACFGGEGAEFLVVVEAGGEVVGGGCGGAAHGKAPWVGERASIGIARSVAFFWGGGGRGATTEGTENTERGRGELGKRAGCVQRSGTHRLVAGAGRGDGTMNITKGAKRGRGGSTDE